MRSVLLAATAARMMSATATMAEKIRLPERRRDDQGGTQEETSATVLVTLHTALSDAETEVIEEDWSECLDLIKTARTALGK